MATLIALSRQVPEHVGHKSGVYLSFREGKGWSLMRLNCIQRIFRWLGAYSSTHLKTVAVQLRKEPAVPADLAVKINAAWEKKCGKPLPPPLASEYVLPLQGAEVKLVSGDLLLQPVDAIVNAANEACLGGGGIDGVIHRAAGPALRAECQALPEARPGVRCPTGAAVITGKGNLPDPIRYVIHAVGPRWNAADPEGAMQTLRDTYTHTLELAASRGLKKIAFPAISAGIFGFGIERSVQAAVHAIGDYTRAHPGIFEEILLVFLPASFPEAVQAAGVRP